MFILSTHTLDATNGSDAEGVQVTLSAVMPNNSKKIIWTDKTDSEGRLKKEFPLGKEYSECGFILTFSIATYLKKHPTELRTSEISLNINLSKPNTKYHFPIILSPFGASLWWSN